MTFDNQFHIWSRVTIFEKGRHIVTRYIWPQHYLGQKSHFHIKINFAKIQISRANSGIVRVFIILFLFPFHLCTHNMPTHIVICKCTVVIRRVAYPYLYLNQYWQSSPRPLGTYQQVQSVVWLKLVGTSSKYWLVSFHRTFPCGTTQST